jgi:RNA polymerase sigma factor (sigma-70 family)
VIADEHLAEDAFQATFLILARKAGTVRGRNLAGWLHLVARRVAVRAAKKQSATRETLLDHDPVGPATPPDSDWKPVLDAEIARLPERFRLPVLFCYLQDYTTDEAARTLGVPRGTVLSRLATARQRLAVRLTSRGVTLPATLAAAGLASNQLVTATARTAAAFAVGEALLPTVPTLLATEVMRMTAWKLPTALATAMVLTVGLCSGFAWVQAGGKGRSTSAVGSDAQTDGGRTSPQDKQTPKRDEDPNKPANEAVLKSLVPQIEALNEYISDRDKERSRLSEQLQDRISKCRIASMDDFATIQKQCAARAEGIRAAVLEVRRDEQALAEMEQRLTVIDQLSRPELANLLQDVHIDPNSKDGIRLGVMYRKQADLESKIRELGVQVKRTERKRPGTDVELAGANEELEVLNSDVEMVEKQAQARAAEVVKTRFARELESRKQKGAMEVQLARQAIVRKQGAVREDERKLDEQFKLGLTVGGLENEIALIRDKLQKIEWDIRDNQDKRNKLELLKRTYPLRPPEMTIEQVAKELAEIRRDLAELKRK